MGKVRTLSRPPASRGSHTARERGHGDGFQTGVLPAPGDVAQNSPRCHPGVREGGHNRGQGRRDRSSPRIHGEGTPTRRVGPLTAQPGRPHQRWGRSPSTSTPVVPRPSRRGPRTRCPGRSAGTDTDPTPGSSGTGTGPSGGRRPPQPHLHRHWHRHRHRHRHLCRWSWPDRSPHRHRRRSSPRRTGPNPPTLRRTVDGGDTPGR